MSRSNPTISNPATRFMEWKGGEEGGGQIVFWDKADQQQYQVEKPFTFIVLDELNTITGFSKAENAGFWSNEVRDMNKSELVVRSKSGIVARGLYKDIKDEIKAKGAKYTKSIYIAFYNDEKELVLGHLKVSGAALTEWIEFNKLIDVYACAVSITGANLKKNGATKFYVPVLESIKVSKATEANSQELDKVLQNYLGIYMTRKPEEEAIETETISEENEPEPTAAAEAPAPAKPVETLDDGTSTDDAADEPTKKPTPVQHTKKAEVGDKSIAKKLNDVEF